MKPTSMQQTGTLVLAAAILAAALAGCGQTGDRTPPGNSSAALPADLPPTPETYIRLARMLDTHLRQDVLAHWFPRCVDEAGGFHQCFARDWTPKPEPYRFLVHQARQTWTAARVMQYDPALAEEYRAYVAHGIAYLGDVMTDPEHGGPYLRVGTDGKVTKKHGPGKHAYGLSFVIYAGATAFAAAGDEKALALAMETFEWFDAHAHDNANGGYYEALSREGHPVRTTLDGRGGRDGIGTPLGYKSMNAHIHLLEAVAALYHARPDEAVRTRLAELLALVRDRIQVPPGALNYYFTPDWRAVPMHDSFGHDIETAYLMVEASAALGRPDDPATWRAARAIVDHALEWGWDKQHGGFYYSGQAFAGAFERFKSWWTQAEGLNVLLLMHERYGGETDRYWKAFRKQWQFVWDHQVDHEYGGWYARVSEDGESLVSGPDKANPWKAAYHNVRALVETVERLHRLAKQS
ncbi:MAG: AGE family epimerase/isomerase [Phycisphaerae bacterium]